MRARSFAIASIVLASLLSSVARAEDLATPQAPSAPNAFVQSPAAAAAPLPDVVTTRDGSMFRGTILEKVAGDHVDLRLASGETRRIRAADVTYAGSAANEPGASPSNAPAPRGGATVATYGERVRVRFVANDDLVTLFARDGDATATGLGRAASDAPPAAGSAAGYTRICTAPCDGSMPAGAHVFALAKGNGEPVDSGAGVFLARPSTVVGRYNSRRDVRTAGWLTFGLGIGVGAVIMATSPRDETICATHGGCATLTGSVDWVQFGVGAGVAAAGLALGLVLAVQHDKATFEVLPLQAPSPVGRREGLAAPEGITLRARF